MIQAREGAPVVAAALLLVAVGGVRQASGAAAKAPLNVPVSNARGPQSEVSIAVDPRDNGVLVAGSNSAAERTTRAYGSTDGGATWGSIPGPPLPPGSPRRSSAADPTVAIDRNGRQYFAFLRLGKRRAVFVATRSGPGARWTTPSRPISEPPQSAIEDKPMVAVDTSPTSPHQGRVHVAWVRRSTFSIRILVSYSDDGGTTWSQVVAINDDDTLAEFPALATGPGGELYVAWAELTRIAADSSADGGTSFGLDRQVAQVQPASRTVCRLIPAQPANCMPHNPILSVDTSAGPRSGLVYVTFGNPTGAGVWDVYATAFDPKLRPLLPAPVRVHPADGPRPADQFFPASAVDPVTGRLWVCYYDTRADRSRRRAAYTCTASADGALEWTAALRVASVASNESQPNANVRGYGDYEGLAVLGGVAHPVWTDSRRLRALQEEIYTAALEEARLPVPAAVSRRGDRPGTAT